MLIIIADSMEERIVEAIRDIGEVKYRPEDLNEAIVNADVLIVRSATKVSRELLDNTTKLKLIIRAGVGTDNIDKKAAEEKSIKVMNTPAAPSNAVAELALGLMITGLRNVHKAHYQMRNKKWEKKNLVGNEIAGKTLGIIGYGRIGSALGKKAHALGMRVIAYNPPPRHEDENVSFVDDFDSFLSQADVISLHVPLTNDTKNMINKETIAKMKDGAFIINTSRGGIIDEEALYEGCKTKLSGAALDVYKEEPYKGKLLELDNICFTPHVGGSTKEAQLRIGEEVIRILKEEF